MGGTESLFSAVFLHLSLGAELGEEGSRKGVPETLEGHRDLQEGCRK